MNHALSRLILMESSVELLSMFENYIGFAHRCALTEVPLKVKELIFEYSDSVRLTIEKLSLIAALFHFQDSLAVPLSPQPFALIDYGALFGAVALDLVFNPVSLVDSAVEVVENALALPFARLHLSLVSLSVFVDEDTLSVVPVVLPLSEVDVSVVILEDAGAVFLTILELPLIGLPGGILDFLDIGHELGIGPVDVLLQKGLDDAALLFVQLPSIGTILHNDHYLLI